MRTFILAIIFASMVAADPEPFEVSDAAGHLVSKGFRVQREDGNYIRTGHWTFFKPNGDRFEEGEFVNDAREGDWPKYWTMRLPNRNPVEYVRFVYTYKNDAIVYEKSFRMNDAHQLWSEGAMSGGFATGHSKTYYLNGDLSSDVTHGVRGTTVAWVIVSHDGTIIAQSSGDKNTAESEYSAAYPMIDGK